jgi:flagellar hook-associated protein 2
MATSTNLISGLSSGFDWRSVVDQLMQIEHRPVDLVENQKTEYEQKLQIYQSLNSSLLSFKTSAATLAKSESFNLFTTSMSTDSASYSASDFFSLSATSSAAPGSHTIEMSATSTIAQARKISSKSFTSYDTAMGVSGEFLINGRAVKVETSDNLSDLMNKINNLNSGSNATEVTASILTVSTGNYRLILTSDNTGEDAFTIFDAGSDEQNILSTGLGFTDGTTTVKNLLSNGAQSEEFSSSAVSASSMLGLTTGQSGTVTLGAIGNPNRFTVALDLSKSITEIASAINAASSVAGSNITASVVPTTEDGATTYSLKILNTTSFTDDNHVLETLGLLEGGQANVAEEHLSSSASTLTTAAGGGNVIAGSTWGQINTGSDANNVTNGDTITFSGVNHIGTEITGSYTIVDKDVDDVQGLLTAIQNAFSSVDDGSYTVTASIEDGKIRVIDSVSGDSLLSLSVVANNEGGGSLNLGTITASMQGYTMQLKEGKDASIIIDGAAVKSSSNTIDDAISGVTINLLNVESGSTVNFTVSRDYNSVLSSVRGLLDSYNEVVGAINEQFYYDEEAESAGLLQGDGTLSSIKSALVNILTQAITGLPSDLNRLSLVGINSVIDYSDHSKDGTLTLDEKTFLDAFNSNFLGLRRVFIAEGSTTDADVKYIAHGEETVAGEYEVNITQAATRAGVTGTTVLASGIGAGNIETLTLTQGSKVAAVVLNGASGENGSSIDDIVNAVNSELDAEYSQSIVGNVKNTTDEDQTTAITNTTTWSSIYSGGVSAGITDGNVIEFSGHRKNGSSISGTYTIVDAESDTVQGFLSAVESAYNNEVSASIDTNGYLVITDKTTGTSSLDIDITAPGNLNFGAVTTSNLVGSQRNTKGEGASAISETDTWGDLDGQTLAGGEVIKFAGYTSGGTAVEGSYTVNMGDQIGVFLSAIETAYGGSVNASLQDGRVIITDGAENSTLGITIFEPEGGGVDFGTMSGGVTGRYSMHMTASKDGSDHLMLTHDDYGSAASFSLSQSGGNLGLGAVTAGLDVAGTINGEAATGAGQILSGAAPAEGGTTSVKGLVLKYTGTETGAQGTVKITMGAGELFSRVINDITNVIDGYLDYRMESMTERISDYEDQITNMEARLNLKMENMINRFVAMELALAKIQSLSSWLSGQISAASQAWG